MRSYPILPATMKLLEEAKLTAYSLTTNGNCQFASIGALLEPQKEAGDVRVEICSFLEIKSNAVCMLADSLALPSFIHLISFLFKQHLFLKTTDALKVEKYLQQMRKPWTWGDAVTLVAAATLYNLHINIIQQYGIPGTGSWAGAQRQATVKPAVEKICDTQSRQVTLVHITECHYLACFSANTGRPIKMDWYDSTIEIATVRSTVRVRSFVYLFSQFRCSLPLRTG